MGKPNIILLTVDCLRFDRIGANGCRLNTTPNLDRLIEEEGVNFTQTIAGGPSTMAAFPALFTSSYPVMYGGTRFLSEDRTTIAQVLSQHSYTTIGISSNPYITPEFGYDRGFTKFWDSAQRARKRNRKKVIINKFLSKNSKLWKLFREKIRNIETRKKKETYPSAEKVNQIVSNMLNFDDGNRPIFLWAHYMDLHYPYNLSKIDLTKTSNTTYSTKELGQILSILLNKPKILKDDQKSIINEIYNASLKYFDYQLGLLFKEMRLLGIWDNSVVVVTADHGEELFEENRFGHGDEGENSSFSEELLHIPLVLKMPSLSNDKQTITALTSQLDIAPTLLNIVNLPFPENWYGKSTLPLINHVVPTLRDAAITQRGVKDSFSLSWRTTDWKFIINAFSGEMKLHPISKKAKKLSPESNEYKAISKRLYTHILEHLRDYEEPYSIERLARIELDDGIKKQLEDLGYL
jgi:arylsulfatase A-like enzyme